MWTSLTVLPASTLISSATLTEVSLVTLSVRALFKIYKWHADLLGSSTDFNICKVSVNMRHSSYLPFEFALDDLNGLVQQRMLPDPVGVRYSRGILPSVTP